MKKVKEKKNTHNEMNLKREIVGNKHFAKSKTTAQGYKNCGGGGGEDPTMQPFSFHFLSSCT